MSWKADKNLVAWYRCEETSGTTLRDETGNFDANCSGAFVAGGSPIDGIRAVDCSTTNGISMPATGEMSRDSTTNWTAACWVKLNNAPTNDVNIISFLSAALRGIGVKQNSTTLQFIAREAGGTAYTISTSTDLRDLLWHHVAFGVKDNILYGFRDGVQVGTVAISLPTSASVKNSAGTNDVVAGTAEFMDGYIDDIKVFNRFLPQAEILHLMHGRGAWPMGQ